MSRQVFRRCTRCTDRTRLGHDSHSFTADTSQHVIPGMGAAAADRFDQLVFGQDAPEAAEGAGRPVDVP